MNANFNVAQKVWNDIRLCVGFYTMIPIGSGDEAKLGHREFAQAQWAAPLAGVLIGSIGAAIFALAQWGGLSDMMAAVLALSGTILTTGALHEDGLADVADGFGGGRTKQRKLEIMRDSCVGTYGVLALLCVFMLRCTALAGLYDPVLAAKSLIAAHVASRALLPAFMRSMPAARASGLTAQVDKIPTRTIVIALLLGGIGLAVTLQWVAIYMIPLLAVWFMILRRVALAHIGGHTGDVLGTLQQGAETLVLVAASLMLNA